MTEHLHELTTKIAKMLSRSSSKDHRLKRAIENSRTVSINVGIPV